MAEKKNDQKTAAKKPPENDGPSDAAYKRTVSRVKALEDRVAVLADALEADLGVDLSKAEDRLGAQRM